MLLIVINSGIAANDLSRDMSCQVMMKTVLRVMRMMMMISKKENSMKNELQCVGSLCLMASVGAYDDLCCIHQPRYRNPQAHFDDVMKRVLEDKDICMRSIGMPVEIFKQLTAEIAPYIKRLNKFGQIRQDTTNADKVKILECQLLFMTLFWMRTGITVWLTSLMFDLARSTTQLYVVLLDDVK